jgi:hypothetical protein
MDIYYYTNDRGSCEVDFIIDTGEQMKSLLFTHHHSARRFRTFCAEIPSFFSAKSHPFAIFRASRSVLLVTE